MCAMMPNEDDLRVWLVDRRGVRLTVPVRTPAQGRLTLDAHLGARLIELTSEQLATVEGMEVYRNGEWVEWTDERGLTVSKAFDDERRLMR